MVQIDAYAGLRSEVAFKAPCRVATTAAITLSGLQTIDGITVVDGDRVLVKDQSDTSENGIYDVSATAWSRSQDFDGNLDVTDGTLVRVRAGTAGAGKTYGLTGTNPIVIGTSAIEFEVINMSSAAPDIADFLAAADDTAARAELGLEIGSDVQAYNAELAKLYTKANAIASASTVDLDAATGNFVHITGTTIITAVTLSQGRERTVVFDDALTLTNGAGLLLGGANIVTAAGDVAVFRGEGASVTRLVGYQRADRRSIQDASATQKGAVALASQSDAEGGTESTKALTSLTLRQALRATGSAPIFACRGWVLFDGRGTVSITASGNVSSITDNGTGDYTINFTTALPDANYAVGGTCLTNAAGAVQGGFLIHGTGSAGSTTPTLKSTTQLRIMAGLPNSTGAADMNSISVMVFR